MMPTIMNPTGVKTRALVHIDARPKATSDNAPRY